jgi:hypothetical protein
LRRGGAAGVQTPQIDGQLPGDGDNSFLALRSGGAGSLGQQLPVKAEGEPSAFFA